MAKADGAEPAARPGRQARTRSRRPGPRMTKARPRAAIVVITALAGLSLGYGVYAPTTAHTAL
ncbi:hypothetical protein [Streptomyces sp. NPDC056527]|uniref:hypothetical protein n=1 Tax=Streptomyces sp. NPDC056527 TaxID=3345853 RepID=UPI0036783648